MNLSRKNILVVNLVHFFLLAVISCSSNGPGTNEPVELPPVVFLADKDVDNQFEIYISRNGGTEITKLSNVLDPEGDVIDFAVSPDGRFVAYLADQATDNAFAFYVVDIDGAAPGSPVSPSLPPGNVLNFLFAWAPDSSRIAYIADQEIDNKFELYTNNRSGTNNVKVSGTLDDGANVRDFAWAPILIPSKRQIAYRADQDTLGVVELYSTFADTPGSSGSIVVSGALNVGQNVEEFKWSPDALLLAYRANQNNLSTIELYTTAPDIRAPVRVSGTNTQNGREVTGFDWSPDGTFIAFRINKTFDITIFDVYTTLPRAAGDGTRVSGPFSSGPGVSAYAWASNSADIGYIANQEDPNVNELFVGSAGVVTSGVRVSDSIDPITGSHVFAFSWAPDAALIAFSSDINTTTVNELFTTQPVVSAIGDDVKITEDLTPGESVQVPFKWSPDSERVAYLANQEDILLFELFSATPNGRIIDKVSDGGSIISFEWEIFGQGIGYIADQEFPGVFELFTSLPDGSDNTKISGSMSPAGGDVIDFEWVP